MQRIKKSDNDDDDDYGNQNSAGIHIQVKPMALTFCDVMTDTIATAFVVFPLTIVETRCCRCEFSLLHAAVSMSSSVSEMSFVHITIGVPSNSTSTELIKVQTTHRNIKESNYLK